MDREKAREILQMYGQPVIHFFEQSLALARQTEKEIKMYEAMSDDELVNTWKELTSIIYVEQQVSLNDLQALDLVSLEIDGRENIDVAELRQWYHQVRGVAID